MTVQYMVCCGSCSDVGSECGGEGYQAPVECQPGRCTWSFLHAITAYVTSRDLVPELAAPRCTGCALETDLNHVRTASVATATTAVHMSTAAVSYSAGLGLANTPRLNEMK